MRVEVEDLRTFVEVADAGGVSPAARRLGLAKSIVSRRLAKLENELGVQLLARTTRGAALTEAGVTFREHAARMCAELEAAREEILPAGELRGRLRLAAPSSFGPEYFAPALAQLARRPPSSGDPLERAGSDMNGFERGRRSANSAAGFHAAGRQPGRRKHEPWRGHDDPRGKGHGWGAEALHNPPERSEDRRR